MMTFVVACQDKPKNPVAVYGDAMIDSYEKGKKGGETGNLDALRKAVAAYHAVHDAYPLTLDEVMPLVGSKMDLTLYDYDSQTGTVGLKAR